MTHREAYDFAGSFPASGTRRTRHPDSGEPWGIGRLQIDSTFIHKEQLGGRMRIPIQAAQHSNIKLRTVPI
jgi:hypothetical protein